MFISKITIHSPMGSIIPYGKILYENSVFDIAVASLSPDASANSLANMRLRGNVFERSWMAVSLEV